ERLLDGGDVLGKVAHGDRVQVVVDGEPCAFEAAAEESNGGGEVEGGAVMHLEDFVLVGLVFVELFLFLRRVGKQRQDGQQQEDEKDGDAFHAVISYRDSF